MLECRARARRRVDSSEVRDQRGLGVGPGRPFGDTTPRRRGAPNGEFDPGSG